MRYDIHSVEVLRVLENRQQPLVNTAERLERNREIGEKSQNVCDRLLQQNTVLALIIKLVAELLLGLDTKVHLVGLVDFANPIQEPENELSDLLS